MRWGLRGTWTRVASSANIDIEAVLAEVRRVGGSVVTEETPIPTMGWSARFRDSEGNVVGLFQEDSGAGR